VLPSLSQHTRLLGGEKGKEPGGRVPAPYTIRLAAGRGVALPIIRLTHDGGLERMMGLEPTTFCMKASGATVRSH
jgi:hypothetical protein